MTNLGQNNSIEDFSRTTKELLARFSSSIFACDISGDTRYIRCDFPKCRQHTELFQGKPCWILNTLRNVKVLENHVTKEVHHYMKEIDGDADDQGSSSLSAESQQWIEKQQLPEGTRKVLVVFSLKDRQSQFGDWISLFLKAAFMLEGQKQDGCLVITQNFVSRLELMECIAKLKFLSTLTVEVVAVLSCHSSCQGQVFSCTPLAIGKQCGFEEFCSLHDFVMACQTVLLDSLMAVHVSSCFTLKLDCSHSDWPVEADWLKTKLKCILSGSTKEVYETGSQVADLHLMLSTIPCGAVAGTCGTLLKDAVDRACSEGFPDLAREMGLEVLSADKVDDKISREGKEDQVTPPGLVMSSIRVVILVQVEDEVSPEEGSNEAVHCGQYIALARAITANLQTRKSSDVKFEYKVLEIKTNGPSSLRQCLKENLRCLPCDSLKVLFVALGPVFTKPKVDLVEVVNEWSKKRNSDICYGVHFQHVTAMQAYAMKNKLKEIRFCGKDSDNASIVYDLAVTGLVDNSNKNCSASFPVLLYMIQLAVGENGNRLAKKIIPSAVYSNKPVSHGISSWTLEEVYMETSHVLSGLSRKCGLHLLSPASKPVKPTVVTCHSSTGPTLELPNKDDECINLPSTSESATCQSNVDPTSSKGSDFRHEKDEHINLSDAGLLRKEERFASKMALVVDNFGCKSVVEECLEMPSKREIEISSKITEMPSKITPAASYSSSFEEKGDRRNSELNRAVALELPRVNPSFNCTTAQDEGRMTTLKESGSLASCKNEPARIFDLAKDHSLNEMEVLDRDETTRLYQKACVLPVSHELSSAKVSPLHQKQVAKNSPATSVSENVSLPCEEMQNIRNLSEDRDDLNPELVGVESPKRESLNVGSFLESGKLDEKNLNRMDLDQEESQCKINLPRVRTCDGVSVAAGVESSEYGNSLGDRDELHSTSLNDDDDKDDDDGRERSCSSKTCAATDASTKQQEAGMAYQLPGAGEKNCSKDEQGFERAPNKGTTENVLISVVEDYLCTPSQSKNSSPGTLQREDNCNSRSTLESVQGIEKSELRTPESATNSVETSEGREISFESSCEESRSRKRASSNDILNHEEITSSKKSKQDSTCETVPKKTGSCAANEWDKSEDLPLMANVDEVLVKHYILDLSVKFSEKVMKGSILLLIEPRNEEVTQRQFQMTLDSTLVNIESVNEVVLPEDFELKFYGKEQNGVLNPEASSSGILNGFLGNILSDKTQKPLPFKGLPYSVYGWFVRIWKPNATGKTWPRCIWIKYHTSPEGKSLTWATDQDGRPCVYSPGAYINNRSLMPCQEPPVAMSTWQASIQVPEDCSVLMSGNELCGKTPAVDGQVTFLYEMSIPLPCSTLAIAVGWWHFRQSRNALTENGDSPHVPISCRLFAPASLIDSAADELLGYVPQFLEASCELLGPYPFKRLDILVLPKCFACMGLKSPNLVFLSQSVLSGDASMRVRLAHEISHAWFGLLVGAKDWSEEWLSEGFATFMEEKIQSRAEKWSKDQDRFYREMRQILRHRCLLSEIKECDDNLKYLRPKVVKPAKAISTAEAIRKSVNQPDPVRPHSVVQFGQICSRKWTQVHYLKGYFLLQHLATMVGHEEFDGFLWRYVQHYKEQLISSEDFFDFFLKCFPDVTSETMDKFIHEWLERAGLPKSFPKRFDSPDNEFISRVEEEFQVWKKQEAGNKRRKTLKVRKRTKLPTSPLELPEQVVIFLEKLLERETLSHTTLRQLNKCYIFSSRNAEVRHRWCELVVKHKYNPGLPEVRRFLIEDQGMGIYLFGELIISQQSKHRALVDEVLVEIGSEMDRCTYQTVKDMLEGKE